MVTSLRICSYTFPSWFSCGIDQRASSPIDQDHGLAATTTASTGTTMLRNRDVVALLVALVLTRMAWHNNDHLESLAASVHLVFYVPRHHVDDDDPTRTSGLDDNEANHGSEPNKISSLAGVMYARPVAFDVDGDGSSEALVTIVRLADQSNDHTFSWKLRVLDLKPARRSRTTIPFIPSVMFESPPIKLINADQLDEDQNRPEPLHVTTGQLLLDPQMMQRFKSRLALKAEKKAPSSDSLRQDAPSELNDRTRHYFCGTDWHDAAEKCGTPCPGGQPSECLTGERCYADTPCDRFNTTRPIGGRDPRADKLFLTPRGTIPVVWILWSNAEVSMFGLTGDQSLDEPDKKRPSDSLELRHMWQSTALPIAATTGVYHVRNFQDWEDTSLTFFDPIQTGTDTSMSGLLVITGSNTFVASDQTLSGLPDYVTSDTFVALDANSGDVIWQSATEDILNESNITARVSALLVNRGHSSSARRRSKVPALYTLNDSENESSHGGGGGSMVPNCLQSFRRSLLTSDIFPYAYFSQSDSSVQAIHFAHQHQQSYESSLGHQGSSRHAGLPGAQRKHNGGTAKYSSASLSSHHQSHQISRRLPQLGRPNVFVSHNMHGIQVRSLKNGKSLCHLSLWDNTLYADLNFDGTLDSVEVVAGERSLVDDTVVDDAEKWVTRLVRQVAQTSTDRTEQVKLHQRLQSTPLCHALALSGVPIKEQLFTADLCGSQSEYTDTHPKLDLMEGPPLALEPFWGNKGWDVAFSLSNGSVQRLNSKSGRRMWLWNGREQMANAFPTWEDSTKVLFSRVGAERVTLATRPIILAGENSLVVLSAQHGKLLASARFPQSTTSRPILVDVDGDGTSDLLVMTPDAVWGYRLVVRSGTSVFFRIATGLLLMALMLAVLRNRFGPTPGKRSTDV